jgi:hypothetical protein
MVVLALLGLSTLEPVAASACATTAGAAVVLRSSDFNPDVFVWDTQARLINYVTHVPYVTSDEVLRHAVLAKAGTRAVVTACTAVGIHPRLSTAVEDAVQIRIVSGAQRGRRGWISSGDLRR